MSGMLRSTLGSQKRSYFLAFNPGCKARPNFGLKGVGFYSSEVHHKAGRSMIVWLFAIPPYLTGYLATRANVFNYLDTIAGGGPEPLDYHFPKDHKPWEFKFDVGEGYAAGPARYRPAKGAAPLH